MWWSEEMQPHVQLPAPQPTAAILQQLPAPITPAGTIRPGGHVKEDLVDLMMMQNAQMHQVIMNNMTMAALGAFGCSAPQPHSVALSDQLMVPAPDDTHVFHHYYQPPPHCYAAPTLLYPSTAGPRDPRGVSAHAARPAAPPPDLPDPCGPPGPSGPPTAAAPPAAAP